MLKFFVRFIQDRKKSLKIEFLGRTSLGHQGPTRQDLPDPGPVMSRTKSFFKAPFTVVLGREWSGYPAIGSGRPGIRKTFQENCGLVFRSLFILGARLRGRMARQPSQKGSEKVLGRVLGKGCQKGSEKGGLLWVSQ